MDERIAQLSDMIDYGIQQANKLGIDEAEGYGIHAVDFSAEIEKGKPQFTNGLFEGISFRVIADNQIGFAFTRSLARQDIEQTIKNAIHNAQAQAKIDPTEVTPNLPPLKPIRQKVTIDPSLRNLSADTVIEGLSRLQAACEDSPAHMLFLGAQILGSYGHVLLRNTNEINFLGEVGFLGAGGYILTTKGLMPSYGLEFDVKRSVNLGYETLADKIKEETTRGADPRTINYSKKSTVILEPDAMGMIFGSLGEVLKTMLRGDRIYNGDSHYTDRIGEQIAPPEITLVDNPHHPTLPVVAEFDAEGVPTQKTVLIEKGILKDIYLDSKYANLMERPSNGKSTRFGTFPLLGETLKQNPKIGSYVMEMSPGTTTREEIIQETSEGFIIKNLMGVHMSDYSSGRFSVTGTGWYVKNGKVLHAVQDIALSGTIPELLQNIDMVSKERKPLITAELPWIRVQNLNVSGKQHPLTFRLGLRLMKLLVKLKITKYPF